MSNKRTKDLATGGLLGIIGAGIAYGVYKMFSDTEETSNNNNINDNRLETRVENDISWEEFNTNFPKTEISKNLIENAEFLLENISDEYCCILSGDILYNPFITECGHSFDKEIISKYLKKNKKCPMCRNECYLKNLRPNFQLKTLIEEKSIKLLKKNNIIN